MTAQTFRLDDKNTFAAVVVRNDDSKLLSRLGHDHVVRATGFSSLVDVDPDDPVSLSFSLRFEVNAFVVDADSDRPQAKLDGSVSKKDRDATRDNMLAKDQLNAKKHPTLDFLVLSATKESDSRWVLKARLTVRGKSHDFDFPVTVDLNEGLKVQGTAHLTHRDLGLKPYKAPMGALQNREELSFVVDVDAPPLNSE